MNGLKTDAQIEGAAPCITLIAKWGKTKHILSDLSPLTSIAQVKELLFEQTSILPKRQKLIGLSNLSGKLVDDRTTLAEVKMKKKSGNVVEHSFILMGTPEDQIFVDPHEKDDLPDVVDDFDFDFNAGSSEWMQHVANKENLRKFTDDTTVFVMNEPRGNKPLLVLDLDHTLLDFSTKTIQTGGSVDSLKRPFMDQFLCNAYQHYDLVVWSQTSWRWLETKLIELGMLTHPGYKFCFVLDKTCMFSIISTKRDGSSFEHHVKPLQIIWSKFPRWGPHNTIHLDDLSRNFALNVASGLKVTAYFRKKSTSRRDAELVGIGKYLEILARANVNFDEVDFNQWMDVVSGKAALTSSASKGDTK